MKNSLAGMTEVCRCLPAARQNTLRRRVEDQYPVLVQDKCRQCLLCVPVCPDVSIPVKDGKRLDFDYDHCKGCGICASVCPFGAIEMKEGIEP